ncbi:uncharacterized protein BDR25DRAFT_212990 [Lindgomyces ingoldianus]|uniref:Uncharacterized protein n=1 Tax=Lindgomyces ingoldianus TaxID=673940 RepID=A0ACB6R9D4_9PLEO|nr:uncharacterized protein BDR25DRAFT_212990 [Lindgomyces ingoldianus]KAF2475071.1 hypothetical protein BDR25DRAFT_212990 [Lindgomyces ingoldianus]
MAPDKVATTDGLLPSQLQIAFAVAIVRRKPDTITVKDYMVQLRHHLSQGKQRITSRDSHRHFNSVSYWKEQFERVQQSCQQLQQRNVQLERANDHLQNLAIQPEGKVTPTAKRKRRGGKQAPSKRGRPSLTASDHPTLGQEGTFSNDLDLLESVGEAGNTLSRSLYNVHKLCRHQNPDCEAICSNLVQTSRAIGAVITTVSTQQNQLTHTNKRIQAPLEKDKLELSCIIRGSARAFTSILVGLEKIVENTFGHRFCNIVIYETVKMFKTVLDSMTRSARSTAATRLASERNRSSSPAKPPSSGKEGVQSRNLAQFLNAIVAYLDKNNPVHREIFEGFLFVLLDRVSSCLHYCMFGYDRTFRAHEENILDPDTIQKKQEEDLAARLEIPSLVIIFERAITLAPNYLDSRPSSSSSKSQKSKLGGIARSLTYTPARKIPLSVRAKERLQRTLIQCIWSEKDDDELADVLRMPTRLGGLPDVPKLGDRDVTDWFKGEVFRLVGWDILTRERVV